MKKCVSIGIGLWAILMPLLTWAQTPEDASTLPKSQTFDIVTWNLEWFGAPEKSSHASTFSEQLSAVSAKIIDLDADVYALQEVIVTNTHSYLDDLVAKLNELSGSNKWAGSVSPYYSLFWYAPSADYPPQRVAYVYNTQTVKPVKTWTIFSSIFYNSSPKFYYPLGSASLLWSSGRMPYLMEVETTISDKKYSFDLINIHAKCCTDGADRRPVDASFLLDTLNAQYSAKPLIILGDYNDKTATTTSPYRDWYANNNAKLQHIVGLDTGIDHITISDEFYATWDLMTNAGSIGTATTSDHKPVMARFKLQPDYLTKGQSILFETITDHFVTDAPFALAAQSTSGLPVQLSVESGPATISGNMLTLTGETGTVVVTATQPGNGSYFAAIPVKKSFLVKNAAKSAQTITFNALPDVKTNNAPIVLSATASSGLAVSFVLISGPATLSGNTLTLTKEEGTVVVEAQQAGNNTYNVATSVRRQFAVTAAPTPTEQADLQKMRIYPNPFTDSFIVETTKPVAVSLWTIDGRQVATWQVHTTQNLSAHGLEKGVYVLKILDGKDVRATIVEKK